MQVKQLVMKNFRGIDSLDISFHEKINVIAGINGAGKSSIIDCLAILLSRFTSRVKSEHGAGGRFFSSNDVKSGKSETDNEITVSLNGQQTLTWSVSKTKQKGTSQRISNVDQIRAITAEMRDRSSKDVAYNIPLAVYYPTNRAVMAIPLRIRKKHIFDQQEALEQALVGQQGNFRIFFEWFRNREDLENEKRIENSKYRDKQLECVRKAIETLLPGFTHPRIRRSPLRMVFNKGQQELSVDQFSDGEKCLLAMAGDLARRLALANPGLINPLEGPAVVLIDEIELHLHPTWQRKIVCALSETFPNCQFIVSTHSPQVVSEVMFGKILILQKTKKGELVARIPKFSYGHNTDRLLEDLMETRDRPADVKEKLGKLFLEIESNRLESSRELLGVLKTLIGDDPELVKAETLIRRREILGK